MPTAARLELRVPARWAGAAPRSWRQVRALLAFVLAWPAAVWALDPTRTVFQYGCENWSRRNGLPVSGIKAIAQTNDGYLWLGTQQGIVRFDGRDFTPFPVPEDAIFVSQNISQLVAARDGGLWFGLREGTVGHFDGERFAPLDAPWVEPNMQVFALTESRDGSLWVGWNFGFSRWVRGRAAQAPAEQFIGEVPFHALHEDSKGRVWIGAGDGGQLFYWEDGVRRPFPDPSIRDLYFYAIAEDREGNLWLGTQTGLRCYDPELRRKRLPAVAINGRVNAILVDRHGTVWIGTDGAGLFAYREGNFVQFSEAHGLVDDNVLALFEDAEGSLWVGTQGGLTQLSDVKFPTFAATEGLPGEPLGVATSAEGTLWVATTQGIAHLDGAKAKTWGSAAGLPNTWIKRLWQASDGDLYVLDGNRNVLVMSSAGEIVARHQSREWPVALTEDEEGMIVSLGPEIHRVSRDGLTPWSYRSGRPPPMVWVMNLWPGRDGVLWAATHRGVWRVQDGEAQQWSTHNGLSGPVANWIFEDTDGAAWAGLASGIARIKDGQVRNITRADGLFASYVHAIVPDEAGWFWIDSTQGIFRVRRQELNDFADGRIARIECEVFDGQHAVKAGDKGQQEYTAARSRDGRIWFPTVQGVVAIDPAKVPVNPVPPRVIIDRARINGREVRSAAPPRVGAGRGELEFHYTALSFVAPEAIRFRYQLEGYDEEWIEANGRRSAFYTNLAPGRYVFRVQACNADGVWSPEGDALAFALPPRFHQTGWFAGLCGLGILGVLGGAYAWRTRALRRRQKNLQEAHDLLEVRVLRRTAELELANARLRGEVAQRERAQLEAQETNQQLLLASRQAGMAEVATSVLHNVGNVLNSVNVSATLLGDLLRKSKVASVPKLAQLLQENAAKPEFLTQDEKGKRVPAYLAQLAEQLAAEHARMREEVASLRKNVEHIKEIVQMQQSYSRLSGISEEVTVGEIIDDALRLNDAALLRHDVAIVREVEGDVVLVVEKHRVLQILVNLVHNAAWACRAAGRPDATIVLRAQRHEDDRVRIEVEDNGVGIAPENLTRIFTQGFTTRKNGHGYGLHSSANAARAMGGSLAAASGGEGKGAVFTLLLPVKPPIRPGSRVPFEVAQPSGVNGNGGVSGDEGGEGI